MSANLGGSLGAGAANRAAAAAYSPPRPRNEPHWLLRVEDEQMQTLLRASANYASKGYDEALFLKKQRQAARAEQAGGRQFENELLGSMPTRYAAPTTGRSPRSRPARRACRRRRPTC